MLQIKHSDDSVLYLISDTSTVTSANKFIYKSSETNKKSRSMDGLCFKLPSGTNASIGKVLSTQFLAERSQNGGDHRQREQLLCGSPIFWFQQPLLVRLVHFVCCLKSCRRIPCGGRRLRVGSARTFCHQTEKLFFNATCFTISLFYLLAPVIGVNLSRWRRWPSPVSRGE